MCTLVLARAGLDCHRLLSCSWSHTSNPATHVPTPRAVQNLYGEGTAAPLLTDSRHGCSSSTRGGGDLDDCSTCLHQRGAALAGGEWGARLQGACSVVAGQGGCRAVDGSGWGGREQQHGSLGAVPAPAESGTCRGCGAVRCGCAGNSSSSTQKLESSTGEGGEAWWLRGALHSRGGGESVSEPSTEDEGDEVC